jgi:hypothetical protein
MADFYVHTATVEQYLGTAGNGQDLFSAPVTIVCFADLGLKQMLNPSGILVTTIGTMYSDPSTAALLDLSARVQVNGKTARVMATTLNDSGALDLPDHVAAILV